MQYFSRTWSQQQTNRRVTIRSRSQSGLPLNLHGVALPIPIGTHEVLKPLLSSLKYFYLKCIVFTRQYSTESHTVCEQDDGQNVPKGLRVNTTSWHFALIKTTRWKDTFQQRRLGTVALTRVKVAGDVSVMNPTNNKCSRVLCDIIGHVTEFGTRVWFTLLLQWKLWLLELFS